MEIINILKYFFILLLLTELKYAKSKRGELIFVYEHVRHGARGPSASYDSIFNDGVDEYNVRWNYDGELSAIGKKQHYLLGIRNKVKYEHFLNLKEYNPMEILIHATDYNRTHQSINSELMAMYEDCLEPELNDDEFKYEQVNLKYMEDSLKEEMKPYLDDLGKKVNLHSRPVFNIRKFKDKRIFLVDNCIKLDQYRDEKVGKKVRAFYDEFDKKFAKGFSNFINKEYFHNYNKMKSITDHYICDYDNHKDLSIVTKNGIDLDEFLDFSKRFYGSFIFDWFVDDYTSGLEETHLMQDLLGYMDRRIKYHPKITYYAPKMVMDCGHDTTVGPIARFLSSSLGVRYHEFCEFACNIYLELYKEDDGKYTVDYYLDDELIFKEKEFYKEFKEPIESHYWNDTYMDEFCGKKEDSDIDNSSKLSDYSNILFAISIVSSILFLIFITSTIVIFRRLKKLQKKLQENPLLNEETEGAELPALT